MFFRNLTLFRFSPAVAADLAELDAGLAEHRLRDIGPIEQHVKGFVSPLGRNEEALTHGCGPFTLLMAGSQDKVLPAAVVNDEVFSKIHKIGEQEGRKVSGRERKRIKDDVLTELLQRAFVRQGRTAAYLDDRSGWMVVDTSSRKLAENVVSMVREALGSFPAVPLAPEVSPRAVLTDWLATGNIPQGFALGEECELRDPATATGAVVRARRQDMDSEEVREHLRNGKQVFSLGLVFDERLSFVLGEDLSIRKLKFFDVVLDELGDGSRETLAAELDARFALMTLELERLLLRLVGIFKLERPE